MQKVIGLDIGSYSIKAVEIVNTFKSYEITNFYENVVPHLEGVPLDSVVPACMEQLFRENDLRADRIVTAMPGQFISSRILPFNFSDARKIEQAIYAVVEDAVPFHMEDMIVDHQILGQMGNKTFALAVMTRKAFLKNFLELLQRINIDPKLVDIDSLAFYNLSSYMRLEPEECCAMVDVGHEKTSVCIIRGGVLRMFRSINLGGRYVTEFLARDLEISFHEAQRIKHKYSRVMCSKDDISELSGDDRLVVERMTLACNAIVKELGRTFYAFKNWEKTPISRLFVSGGAARVKNFGQLLQDQLEVPTQPTRLDETNLIISDRLSESMAIMPQSVAIGMRSVTSVGRATRKHSQINLRRGEFAYVQNYESMLRNGIYASKLVGVVLLMLFVTYGFKWWWYKDQIAHIQEQYRSEFVAGNSGLQRRFPPGEHTFIRLRQEAVRELQREIDQKSKAVDGFVMENSGSPALIVLKQISEVMPKEVKIDVTRFEFVRPQRSETGNWQLTFRGDAEDYLGVTTIEESLAKVPSLTNIARERASEKPGTGGKVIEFILKADYQPVGVAVNKSRS